MAPLRKPLSLQRPDGSAATIAQAVVQRPTTPARRVVPGPRVWVTVGLLLAIGLPLISLSGGTGASTVVTAASRTPSSTSAGPRSSSSSAASDSSSPQRPSTKPGEKPTTSGRPPLPGQTNKLTSTGAEDGKTPSSAPPAAGEHAPGKPKPAHTQPAVAGVSFVGAQSGRCIDVPGDKAKDGLKLQVWDCNGAAGQKWQSTGGTFRSMGLCLDIAGGSSNSGAPIQLANCNGTGWQQFHLSSAGDLVNSQSDKCVDVVDKKTGNGAELQLWTCRGSSNQKWHTT